MKTLFKYFKPYRWQSVLGPLFKLLEATFELMVPLIVARLVDVGLGAYVDGGYPNADISYIVWMCVILVGMGIGGFAFAVVAQYFAARTATGVAAYLRKDMFKKIQSLSYRDLDEIGTSTLVNRMTGDVDKFQSGVNLFLRLFLRSPFIVFGAIITALIVDPQSFPVFGITVLVLAVVVFAVMGICMPLYQKSQLALDEVTLSTRENLSGAKVLRAFNREGEERALFNARNDRLTKERKFVGGIALLTSPLTYVIVNLGIVALLYTGAIRVEGGALTQGGVIALYNLMSQILIELIKLANLIVTVAKAAASGKRVAAVLEKTPTEIVKDGADGPITLQEKKEGFIRFEGVSLRYNDSGEKALDDITFSLDRGETMGIIGGTGSGKSSLVNLIPHFYDVCEGQVLVDGVDVCERGMQLPLRERVGVVPQKATLFKGSIRDNLLWGKADATDEQLYEALRIAQADEIVREKGGLDAPVEQGGRNFSGGQRQRLTIARALARQPEILILDDSFSALDYLTDAALRKELSRLNTTTIIVSQRTSSVQNADKILVLDDGKVVGLGTHEQLLKDCEVYREIYLSQTTEASA
ncbi:MAG: ABC transporter ATP-binding protein [Clostridia bacterium]|nr:ABC transporter ATP-binding protein [Clostridia bacterium]